VRRFGWRSGVLGRVGGEGSVVTAAHVAHNRHDRCCRSSSPSSGVMQAMHTHAVSSEYTPGVWPEELLLSLGPTHQVTVHLKGVTECYECTPKARPKTYPICTLRNTPDKPIHCIVWAKELLFPRLFGNPDAVSGGGLLAEGVLVLLRPQYRTLACSYWTPHHVYSYGVECLAEGLPQTPGALGCRLIAACCHCCCPLLLAVSRPGQPGDKRG
jgi:hypothetical protein